MSRCALSRGPFSNQGVSLVNDQPTPALAMRQGCELLSRTNT
jgi:hypothetical protein